MAGFFISLEGGEGGGKTTHSNRLCAWLREQGHEVVQTRNPGTQHIREILVRGVIEQWQPETDAILFNADRHELLQTIIQPALEAGKIVVCDRYSDSTYVYQGYGRGVDREWLLRLQKLAIGDCIPDLTLVFDVDAETALARSEGKYKGEHRYEQIGVEFHKRIQRGFREVAAKNPERCVLIDALQPLDEVTAEMIEIVAKRLAVGEMVA